MFLQTTGYGCFLLALGMCKVSYAVGFRQVSALFGALMEALLLKESHWKTRIIGASLLAVGLILIGLAKKRNAQEPGWGDSVLHQQMDCLGRRDVNLFSVFEKPGFTGIGLIDDDLLSLHLNGVFG